MEVWKTIKGFEKYEVSNLGNVKSLKYGKEILLKQENSRCNNLGCYKRVTLSLNNKFTRLQVHRLVAGLFIENPENKKCVNHIDGNPSNNKVENLEWCTHSENELHSYNFLGKINAIRKLSTKDVDFIRQNATKGKFGNIKHLASLFQVDVSTIYNILKNKYYART
jgi:hypothetical protein